MDAELTTKAIMYLEPALRAKGRAMDWDWFNEQLNYGYFNLFLGDNQEEIAEAIKTFTE